MAYDEGLAQRIREVLQEREGYSEKAMFGGVAFMLRGNMACGVIKDEMCLRCGPTRFDELLADPHARLFDFTGRPMKGWLMVDADGLDDERALARWIELGVSHALSLPPR